MKPIKTVLRKISDDYFPGQEVYEVEHQGRVIGLIERRLGGTTWGAYRGSGFSCRFLAHCRTRVAAVNKLLDLL